MKVCVVGAGAVGGHLAARLHAAGVSVSVLARGANLQAIRTNGLLVRDPNQELRAQIPASDEPRELGGHDLIVVAVKATDVAAVTAGLGPLLTQESRVAFVLNGIPWWYGYGDASLPRQIGERVDPHGRIASAIDPERVIGAVFYSLCSVHEPGIVQVGNAVSRLCLGDVRPGPSSAVTKALAEALGSPAIKVEVSADIRNQVWEKLILLLATCPLSVLVSAAPIHFLDDPSCESVGRQLIEEGRAIASALRRKTAVDPDAIIKASKTNEHRPSILQDLDKGRAMEVAALFGVPLEIARSAGLAAPMLELMTSLVKLRARAAGLY